MRHNTITGSKLKAARHKAGLNQTQMAERIGYARGCISYWERKPRAFTSRQCRYGALAKMLKVLEIEVLFPITMRAGAKINLTSPRAREHGVLVDHPNITIRLYLQEQARAAERLASLRVPCGARTRKGAACRNLSERGKRRCKFHGGKSTGPKTAEGKARIAEAQRQRWAEYEAQKARKIIY